MSEPDVIIATFEFSPDELDSVVKNSVVVCLRYVEWNWSSITPDMRREWCRRIVEDICTGSCSETDLRDEQVSIRVRTRTGDIIVDTLGDTTEA